MGALPHDLQPSPPRSSVKKHASNVTIRGGTMKLHTMAAVAVAVAAVAALTVSGAASAAQAVCFSNSTTGLDTNGGTNTADAKRTIQACVDAVDPGGVVHVAAGVYLEAVNVNKPVTLAGAEA